MRGSDQPLHMKQLTAARICAETACRWVNWRIEKRTRRTSEKTRLRLEKREKKGRAARIQVLVFLEGTWSLSLKGVDPKNRCQQLQGVQERGSARR